jgi:hypothetical protein
MLQEIVMAYFKVISLKFPPVVWWSEFLATDPEDPGSNPGATRFSEK